MTTTIVLNLIFAVAGVGAVFAVMRLGARLADGRFDPAEPVTESAEPRDLERAA